MADRQYKVGYKKPPEKTQFKKGKSGNPKGRPKDARNTIDIFEEIINGQITIRENGKSVTVTKREAMLMRLFHKAIEGDPKAIEKSISLMLKIDDKNHKEQVVLDYIFNTISKNIQRAIGDPGTEKWIDAHLSHLEDNDEVND